MATLVWSKSLVTPGYPNRYPNCITIDGNGRIIIGTSSPGVFYSMSQSDPDDLVPILTANAHANAVFYDPDTDLLYLGDWYVVTVLDGNYSVVRSWGTSGSGDGQFFSINGITKGPDGKIYVSDTGNYRVQVFEPDGTFIRTFTPPNSMSPGDIQNTYTGNLYILNRTSHYLAEFTPSGTRVGYFSPGGTLLDYVYGVDIDSAGNIWISRLHDAVVYTRGGVELARFDTGEPFALTSGVVSVGNGDCYISDGGTKTIHKFSDVVEPEPPIELYPCWTSFVYWWLYTPHPAAWTATMDLSWADWPGMRADFADIRFAAGDPAVDLPLRLSNIVAGVSVTVTVSVPADLEYVWFVYGNPDGGLCGGEDNPPPIPDPADPDPEDVDPEVVATRIIKTLRGKSTINTDKSATAVYEVCAVSELRGVYKNLSESVLAGLYKIYSPVEGSTTARYDILSPVPKVIEAKYDISSPVEKALKGLYSIADPVAKVLQGIYAILVPSVVAPLRARYNIGDPVTLRGKYNVAPPPFSAQFVVQIKDKSFITVVDDHDLTVNLDQLPHYTCTFRDPPALYRDYYIVEGNEIRVLYNTGVLFSGIITGTERVSGTNNIAVEAWGMAKALEALKVQSKQQFVSTPANEIAEALLPDEWEGAIDAMPSISYTTEYGDILTHIANLASITGRDWAARQTQVILAVDDIIEETTTTTLVVSGATLAESPDDDCPIGRYVFATNGAARYTGALVTDNTENTLVVSGEPFGRLAIGDHIVVYLRHRLDLTERPATGTPLFKSFKNVGIRNIKRTKDLEKVYSVIVVPGASSMAANQSSVFPVVTLPAHWAETTATESMLADQGTDICLSATATSIILSDASGYAASGIVGLEAEEIYYAGKTGNTLTGCVRGVNGTTAAAHNIFCPVLFLSEYPMANTSFLPASGSVWIGMECLSYTGKSDVGLLGLSRGVGSRAYPHGSGTVVRDASYTVAAPESGSPYALYGERALNVPAVGAVDQQTLDVVAQTYATFSTALTEWGTGKFLHRALPNNVQVGDYFAIGERIDGEIVDTTYRLVGIRLDGESSRLSFGETEEFILDRLRGIDKAMDMAGIKDDKPGIGTVAGVSCNKEVLKVLMPDGNHTYSRLK